MTFSFAVTAYRELTAGRNFGELLHRSISTAVTHPLIAEIVIVNDSPEERVALQARFNSDRVRVLSNRHNLGTYANKIEAIAKSSGDWVITCDSDNYMDRTCIDTVLAAVRDGCNNYKTWYCPAYGKPEFDYRKMIGTYDKHNIAAMPCDDRWFGCLINTGNQTVHRASFLDCFRLMQFAPYHLRLAAANLAVEISADWIADDEACRNIWDARDCCLSNLLWLNRGGSLQILDGMEYEHRFSRGEDSACARLSNDPRVPLLAERLIAAFNRRMAS